MTDEESEYADYDAAFNRFKDSIKVIIGKCAHDACLRPHYSVEFYLCECTDHRPFILSEHEVKALLAKIEAAKMTGSAITDAVKDPEAETDVAE